ncbi:hypothetical protein HGRIS_001691 [Hohenbuehelia grisea]|uniref:Secreted protein n=1 Tax=Hohenbuehelia grisea TaxID=104357 RepID=A0ABR3JIJ6_9AGAR
MKFLFAVIPALLFTAQSVMSSPDAPIDVAIQARAADAAPKFPTLTQWVESHLRSVFDVKQSFGQLNKTIDSTYASNVNLTFSGVSVTLDFLKTNINSQLRDATDISLKFDDVLELPKTAGDESAGIVAGSVILTRAHGRKPKTQTATIFILTVAQDPTIKGGKNVDKRRVVVSQTVIKQI